MANHDLAVHKVNGRFRVYPPVQFVLSGEILHWTGFGTDIKVYIPNSKTPPKTLRPNEVKWTANTKVDTLVEYTYAVYCEADKTFAQGDSDPKIIVK